MILLFEFFAT